MKLARTDDSFSRYYKKLDHQSGPNRNFETLVRILSEIVVLSIGGDLPLTAGGLKWNSRSKPNA
jgi:hypothetical protein